VLITEARVSQWKVYRDVNSWNKLSAPFSSPCLFRINEKQKYLLRQMKFLKKNMNFNRCYISYFIGYRE